ncbi:hypothetical protein D3C81_1315190 [compost metagenome]
MDLGDPQLHIGRQGQVVHFFEQCRVQFAAQQIGVGQGATVENRVAFTAGCHQVGLGQYLEVMAHAGLADAEDLRQFQYAERVVGQCAQNIQPQRIAAGLAQGRQLIAIVMANGRHA